MASSDSTPSHTPKLSSTNLCKKITAHDTSHTALPWLAWRAASVVFERAKQRWRLNLQLTPLRSRVCSCCALCSYGDSPARYPPYTAGNARLFRFVAGLYKINSATFSKLFKFVVLPVRTTLQHTAPRRTPQAHPDATSSHPHSVFLCLSCILCCVCVAHGRADRSARRTHHRIQIQPLNKRGRPCSVSPLCLFLFHLLCVQSTCWCAPPSSQASVPPERSTQ